MKGKTFDQFWLENKPDLVNLIAVLKTEITNDMRESEDEDPYMQITISVNEDCTEWTYQTGDNSYSGGCYLHAFWGVGYIYKTDKPQDVANELIGDLANQIEFED